MEARLRAPARLFKRAAGSSGALAFRLWLPDRRSRDETKDPGQRSDRTVACARSSRDLPEPARGHQETMAAFPLFASWTLHRYSFCHRPLRFNDADWNACSVGVGVGHGSSHSRFQPNTSPPVGTCFSCVQPRHGPVRIVPRTDSHSNCHRH